MLSLFMYTQGAFELISTQCPKAVAGMLDGMARRLSAASAARANPNQYALPSLTHTLAEHTHLQLTKCYAYVCT